MFILNILYHPKFLNDLPPRGPYHPTLIPDSGPWDPSRRGPLGGPKAPHIGGPRAFPYGGPRAPDIWGPRAPHIWGPWAPPAILMLHQFHQDFGRPSKLRVSAVAGSPLCGALDSYIAV